MDLENSITSYTKPIIRVGDIRRNCQLIMAVLDGASLDQTGDDKEENLALVLALIKHTVSQMRDAGSLDYLPTTLDFINNVKLPVLDNFGDILPSSEPNEALVASYFEDLKPYFKRIIQEIFLQKKDQFDDAYLYLSIIYFAIAILGSTFNLPTSRKLLHDFMEKEVSLAKNLN